MSVKIHAKELNRSIRRIKKLMQEVIFDGLAVKLNENVVTHLGNHPRSSGNLLKSFRPTNTNGKRRNVSIGRFDEGYAAVLELGAESHEGYLYPYDPMHGTFIRFQDEPALKDWALSNIPDLTEGILNNRIRGLRVGKNDVTRFGTRENKWFTGAVKVLKSPTKTRASIVPKLKQIQIR